ncbi:MAG TPA: hypothetical protein VK178_14100 [Opitutaceae bacterium]|nr:hypothetical protein [Opitutaceae bacterium]
MRSEKLMLRGANPRRNLPLHLSRKRTESNFLCAFERAFRKTCKTGGIVGRDIEISGYGIADWIWIGFRANEQSEDATAFSLQQLPRKIRLFAFELKMTQWKKALKQAFRYSYFADRSIVVLPPHTLSRAIPHLDVFHRLRIGLWGFDPRSEAINRVYTPRELKARNQAAKEKAVQLFLRRTNFCQLQKPD